MGLIFWRIPLESPTSPQACISSSLFVVCILQMGFKGRAVWQKSASLRHFNQVQPLRRSYSDIRGIIESYTLLKILKVVFKGLSVAEVCIIGTFQSGPVLKVVALSTFEVCILKVGFKGRAVASLSHTWLVVCNGFKHLFSTIHYVYNPVFPDVLRSSFKL